MARTLLILAVLFAAIRVAGAVRSAQTSTGGDFAATLPGAYAEQLNPRLWDSEDLRGSWGFHKRLYLYGPTQYLTLYPIVFLDSYAQIARVLLFVYAGVLAWSIYLVWRTVSAGDRKALAWLAVTAVISVLFFPLLQAYGQREFEVVVFFFIVAATYLLVTGRDGAAGALLGYVTWFKFWPIVFVGYFLGKRQFRALSTFVLASALTLGLSHLVFGLDRFTMFNAALLGYNGEFWTTLLIPKGMENAPTFTSGEWSQDEGRGFCNGWTLGQTTMVSVRWAVCGLMFHHRGFPAPLAFYSLSALFGLLAAAGFVMAERRGDLSADERKWRIIWEVSLLSIGAASMLRAHYHYFILLALPVNALAYYYATGRQWWKLATLGVAYLLLTAFVVPLSLSSRLFGLDFWGFYTRHVIYFYGFLILIGLLLWEYVAIGLRRPGRPAPAM